MSAAEIRNVSFLGSSDSGKTSLVEALALQAGAINRLGRVEEGNTLCDFNPKEKEKKHSLGAAVVHLASKEGAVNLIDTPGYPDFVADAIGAMGAAGTAVLTLAASQEGLPFHARRLWMMAGEAGLARAVVLTRVDHENLDLDKILAKVRSSLGQNVVPMFVPDQVGPGFSKVMPVAGADGALGQAMVEAIVEGDDALMERYLEEGEISEEDLLAALPHAMAKGTFMPLFFVNPLQGTGIEEFHRFLCHSLPGSSLQVDKLGGANVEGGGADDRTVVRVWKVLTDKHLGQVTYLRVLQGTLASEAALKSSRGGKTLKMTGLSTIFGKDLKPVDQALPGDLVAVTRVEDLYIGDELVSEGDVAPHEFPFPEPFTSLAVHPRSRADEQKIGPELAKIAKEDPTFRFRRDSQTHEQLIDGLSELHLKTWLQRLEGRGVGLETTLPRIPYQETVTSRAEGHYRHKKQTGGRGQFAECFIRMNPCGRGEGFRFVDKIVGGSIPRQFIPAVDKGMKEQCQQGILSGSQVVDVEVELYDGKFHDVDSDEFSFKLAGARALKDAFLKAKPILLEPIMVVEIIVPSRFFGDVTGDLNTRRGRVLGMESDGDFQIIKAHIPLAEVQTYSTPLRSMTAGEGTFTMKFDHYDKVPSHLQEKIVAASNPGKNEH